MQGETVCLSEEAVCLLKDDSAVTKGQSGAARLCGDEMLVIK